VTCTFFNADAGFVGVGVMRECRTRSLGWSLSSDVFDVLVGCATVSHLLASRGLHGSGVILSV
jgi:hypothetical protein